jgi:hypothetical protein
LWCRVFEGVERACRSEEDEVEIVGTGAFVTMVVVGRDLRT